MIATGKCANLKDDWHRVKEMVQSLFVWKRLSRPSLPCPVVEGLAKEFVEGTRDALA